MHRHNDEIVPGPRLEEIAELRIEELDTLRVLWSSSWDFRALYKKPTSREKPQ